MTIFTDLLAMGDLRSDGLANEVVKIVIEKPELLQDLVDALASDNPSVRGHAADALEKVARVHPDEVIRFLPSIRRQAISDEVPMVRWHLTMLLSHVSITPETTTQATQTLVLLLKDTSPFVRSWAITGLTIIAQRSPVSARGALRAISPLASDASPAVAKRAQTAIRALTDPTFRLPKSWVKTPDRRDPR